MPAATSCSAIDRADPTDDQLYSFSGNPQRPELPGTRAGSIRLRIAFQVAGAEQPQRAGRREHQRDDEESLAHVVKPVGQEADDDRRYDVAQRVDDEDAEGKPGGAYRRGGDVRQDRVGRTGAEEQAEDGQEDEDPHPGERSLQRGEKYR